MPQTVTLSSVGTSTPLNLDWRGSKPVTAIVTLGSTTMTADFTLQYTLDDLQLTTTQTWVAVGSSTGSSATHFSSANADAGVTVGFLYPIAGLRLSSTALSSSSLTLKVLQGVGW
jgi:hypothetical protein